MYFNFPDSVNKFGPDFSFTAEFQFVFSVSPEEWLSIREPDNEGK